MFKKKEMLKQVFIIVCMTLIPFIAMADKVVVKGHVYDENKQPVIGANVYWEGTQDGTTTDLDGFFELNKKGDVSHLITSYIGYVTVSTPVKDQSGSLEIVLKGEVELNEVVVSERKVATVSSRTSVLQTQKITYDEICRAACCNLAESFETNPSVDVSYSDASTGARQIKLLGLSGTYVQMLTENYPNFRGASSLYGLDYVPRAST